MSPENNSEYGVIAGRLISRGVSNTALLLTLKENPGMTQNEVIERARTNIRERLGEEAVKNEKTMEKTLKNLEKEGLIEGEGVWNLTEEGQGVINFMTGGLENE
jgi:DNA-binding PadR family transcriptional regulator